LSERFYKDWLSAFLAYTDHMEAPRIMRSWAGISAIAGALRKHCWIDQDQFRWTPGLFVIFVGPPGVITKSTTADLSMNLLREVPGIKFGPNNITWQALVTAFSQAAESFQFGEDWYPMSAITLVSRELGSLINPKDQDLVNLFIELWDGDKKYEKVTKMAGDDVIDSPWINLLGATTPSWIADNMPKSAVSGGFVSRCVFLYGDEKEKYVPYPKLNVKPGHDETRRRLIHDLEHIALTLVGEYELTREAYAWGSEWYVKLWTDAKSHYDDDLVMGHIARKQTHVHKLAMVLAASRCDCMRIQAEDLQVAVEILQGVEEGMPKVFSRIGRSEQSLAAERFVDYIKRKGRVAYQEAYQQVHLLFPDFRDFEGILTGAIRSGQVFIKQDAATGAFWLEAAKQPAAVQETAGLRLVKPPAITGT
jgi:hypothetical protein